MLRRQHFLLGSIGYAAIIVYGSLVPFHFHALGLSELIRQFSEVFTLPVWNFSKSDFLANVLLFVPLSFLLMGSCLFGRSSRGWQLLIPVALLCVVFGASIECLQLMFPPRKAALNDIAAQSIGSLLGGLLWLFAGAIFAHRVNDLTGKLDSSHRVACFLPIYLLMIVILETVPFDFTLSPVELVHKWREGRISLVPFAAFLDPERGMITKSLWHIVLFLPVGLLLSYLPRMRGVKAVLAGLLIAGGVEAMQLLVLSRHFEPTDIVTGGFATWLGWWSMQLHNRYLGERDPQGASNSMLSLLFLAWFIVVASINWYPFDFTLTGTWDRFNELSLVPFADYQQKHYLSAFDDIIHKLLLYMLLGLLLSANPQRRRSAVTVAFLGALVSTVIELGQVLLPTRYPSLSDVILGFVACYAGHRLVHLMRQTGQPAIQLRVNHPV